MADHIKRDINFFKSMSKNLTELARKIEDQELPFSIDGEQKDELMTAIRTLKTLSIETGIALDEILKDEEA